MNGTSGQNTMFFRCIESVFRSWTALQLAVAHSFGGQQSREKAQWLISATEKWFFENDDIEAYELEDFFSEIMMNEFDTVIYDNSIVEISEKICHAYALCQQNRNVEIEQFIASLSTQAEKSEAVSASQSQQTELDDDADDDDMDITSQNMVNHINTLELNREDQSAMEEHSGDKQTDDDSDGWKTVSKSNRRKR